MGIVGFGQIQPDRGGVAYGFFRGLLFLNLQPVRGSGPAYNKGAHQPVPEPAPLLHRTDPFGLLLRITVRNKTTFVCKPLSSVT